MNPTRATMLLVVTWLFASSPAHTLAATTPKPTIDRANIRAEFKAKDAAIADLRDQLADALDEITDLKAEIARLKDATSTQAPPVPSTCSGPPGTDSNINGNGSAGSMSQGQGSHVACTDVELHATYVEQPDNSGLPLPNSRASTFTGTIVNVGNQTLNKIDVYCRMQGFKIADIGQAGGSENAPVDAQVYYDVYGDTFRNLQPGESRQLSIVASTMDIMHYSPTDPRFVNLPAGKKVWIPNYPTSITLVAALASGG